MNKNVVQFKCHICGRPLEEQLYEFSILPSVYFCEKCGQSVCFFHIDNKLSAIFRKDAVCKSCAKDGKKTDRK